MKYYFALFFVAFFIFIYVEHNNKLPVSDHFLYRVRTNVYVTQGSFFSFNEEGNILYKKEKNEIKEEFYLFSVFTSSKAIYLSDSGFIGVLIVEDTLYKTPKQSSLFNINFNRLNLGGLLVRRRVSYNVPKFAQSQS